MDHPWDTEVWDLLALSSRVQGVCSGEQGDVLGKLDFTEFLETLEQGWSV